MVEIIPSVLTNNRQEAIELISRCNDVVKRVQVDIVDGFFANNKTIDPLEIVGGGFSVGLDFHLMTKDPINWIEKCANAGADRIIGQIETMGSQMDFVREVQLKNLRSGLAIDLDTPVGSLNHNTFSEIDVVLVMSVKAGFGGQTFAVSTLNKIIQLNEIRIHNRTPFRICVDGGETEELIDDSVIDGADEVVIGRRLFNGDLLSNIKKFESASLVRH